MIDLSELSDSEKWELLSALIREGKGPRVGRPKKNSDIPKWSDFGLTRKEVWRNRRLAEISVKDLEAFADLRAAKGRPLSYRSIFVRFGKINVPNENDFNEGTPLGDVVTTLLAPTARLLPALNKRERRLVKRALLARITMLFKYDD